MRRLSPRRLPLICAALLVCGGTLKAQTFLPLPPPNISLLMAKDDARLDQKITITRPDICLGELLEELSKQTKVDLNMDPDSNGSGVSVLIRFRDNSLREVMNALWSVVSYKNAEWEWDRRGKRGGYTYTLIKTRKSESLSPQIEAMVDKTFEHYVDLTLIFSRLTPAEREARQEELYEALMWDKEMGKKFRPEQWEEASWNSIKLLDAMLTKPEILKLMNGGVHQVALEKASASAQELFKKVYVQRYPSPEGSTPIYPSQIVFDSYGRRDVASPIFPMIFIRFDGRGSGAMSGGVLELGFRKFIESLWRFPEEKATNELESRKIPPLATNLIDLDNHIKQTTQKEEETLDRLRLNSPMWQRYFLRIGEGTDTSVCVIVRHRNEQIPSPDNKTIREVLHPPWQDRDYPSVKWRDDILIATYLTWYQDTESSYSYRTVLEAKRLMKKHLPSSAELAQFGRTVTGEQWAALQERYALLRKLMGSKLALNLAAANSSLTRINGIPITDEVLSVLPVSARKARDDGATSVRLRSVTEAARPKYALPEQYLLELQTLNKDGKWAMVEGWPLW